MIKEAMKFLVVGIAFIICVLMMVVIAMTTKSLKWNTTYKYIVVHHDSICDTIETSKYQYLLEENILNAREGGVFTKVKYIKRIE